MFSAQAKYTVLLIAIWATIASVVASQDPRFEQYPKVSCCNLQEIYAKKKSKKTFDINYKNLGANIQFASRT